MAVWQPEELADDVPIVLGQPVVVQLNLWSSPYRYKCFLIVNCFLIIEPVELPNPLVDSPRAVQPLLLPAIRMFLLLRF